jgi:hypothetical protein
MVASFLPLLGKLGYVTLPPPARLQLAGAVGPETQTHKCRTLDKEESSIMPSFLSAGLRMNREQEFQVAATSMPRARLWATSAAAAVAQYVRAFRPEPGSNVILSPVDNQAQAELFAVTQQGPRRLQLAEP